MKKINITIISLFLMTIIIFVNTVSFKAMVVDVRTAHVYASQSSTYTIRIPKTIVLSGEDGSAAYSVSMTGNISGTDRVLVIPNASFKMSQEGKTDIVANVTQEDTCFTYEKGVRPDSELSFIGEIIMESISAGNWFGVFNFNIYSEVDTVIDSIASTETDINGNNIIGKDTEQNKNTEYDETTYVHYHAFTLVEIKNPTCTEDGYAKYECSKYGCDYSYTEILYATGHYYEEEIIDSDCLNGGYTIHTCTVCGHSYTDNHTDALGHEFVDGVCIRCGAFEAGLYNSEGLVRPWEDFISLNILAVDENGEVYNPQSPGYWLPTELQGKLVMGSEVTSIREDTFKDCVSLSIVVAQDNLKEIKAGAFRGCASLDTFIFPKSIETIGEGAFEYCQTLKEINLPDTIKEISDRAFFGCSSLKTVNMKGYLITRLNESTFEHCTSLENVILPEGLTIIDNRAFYNCCSLKNITIFNNVNIIGESAFDCCSSMQSITIPCMNIYNIGQYAFRNCSSLQKISVSGVEYTDQDTFNNKMYNDGISYSLKLWIFG